MRRTINAIDVHAAGEPGRVIIGQNLHVKGTTMAERLRYCTEHLDDLRPIGGSGVSEFTACTRPCART